MYKIAFFGIGILTMFSCKSDQTKKTPADFVSTDTLTTFILPSIPAMLNTPETKATYLANHYWDYINFADTNYIHHPEITEQGWANFIDLLKLVPAEEVNTALHNVMKKAAIEKKCFLYIKKLAEQYLYDPNSPMRNEEYFIPILEAQLELPVLTDAEKIRPKSQLEMALRNRVGTQALDFWYTLASGKKNQMHSIQANYTLLFFNNPGCNNCAETADMLQNSDIINQAIERKQLQILSLYPDGDMKEWEWMAEKYPATWIKAYDKNQVIQEKNLYDLKAIPCIYLLDKNKKVLLKDTTPEAVEYYLSLHS